MRPCLVLTRPRAAAESFADQARAGGWRGEVLIAPLMQIRLIPPDPERLGNARVLIFTSQHGVASLEQASAARDWPVWTVGPRTHEAARRAGFGDIGQASGGDAASLLADLQKAQVAGPFLHLHGAHLACDLAAALRARGQEAEGMVVYTQDAVALEVEAVQRLQQGGDLVLAAFSPRSAALLRDALTPLALSAARLHLVAISAAAASPLADLPLRTTRIAATPDADGMRAALGSLQAALEPLEKPR